VPGSGDEPHLVSLSFDDGTLDYDTWDAMSRSIAALNLLYGEASPLYIPSAGNGGPGYGTATSPKPATALVVGASTQYGTINAWGMGVSETVSSPQRVNWGEVARLSGRAPGADGSGAVDLVANGMVGSGAWPLNRAADGTRAYLHWYGTSRSAPDAAGMAALAYQAFFQAHGRYPTWQEGTRLMLNGATDRGFDPFSQGAGAANAFYAAQSALDAYGIQVDPPRVEAGSFRGQRYPAFPGGLARSERETVTLTLRNPAAVPVTVSLAARQLVTVGRYLTTVATLNDRTSNYSAAPDYAIDLTSWVAAHPDADLMVVRMAIPYEHFDTVPPTPADNSRNRWALVLYNWWDDDDDGVWWDDGNEDGWVDFPDELDNDDEWMRFDFSNHNTAVQELAVGQPYTRSLGAGSAGIWAGAAHTTRSSGDNSTTLLFEVSFYRRERWEAVSLPADRLVLPAGGEEAVQVEIVVPPDASYGLHQGVVLVEDAGRTDVDPLYEARTVQVPLVWGVWPDVAVGATVGGSPRAATRYDNGVMGAGFNWNYLESGDWRFYNFDLQEPPAGSVLLAHTTWEDYPADLDTHLLGPVMDDYSADNPGDFGPCGLDRVGGSVQVGERPKWDFQTTTGGTEEWAAAPARDGLHTLVQQAVLLGGHQAVTPFTSSLGLLAVTPYPLRFDPAACDPTCTLRATLNASIDVPLAITASHHFGWFAPNLLRDGAIAAGENVTHGLAFTEPLYRLEIALELVTGTGRLDLALYDDNGDVPGAWDGGDVGLGHLVAAQVDQELIAYELPAGDYWLRVEGKEVAPEGGTYDLRVLAIPESGDDAFAVGNLPAELIAHQPASISITVPGTPTYNVQGHLVLGLSGLSRVIEMPLLAVRQNFLPVVWR
jgi:hypothetical protein